MNFKSPTGAPQGPDLRYSCVRCGVMSAAPGCVTVRSEHARPGDYALLCHECAPAAAADPRLRRQVEISAGAAVVHSELKRIFAQLGIDEIPTTPAEIDASFGWPPGTADLMFARGPQ